PADHGEVHGLGQRLRFAAKVYRPGTIAPVLDGHSRLASICDEFRSFRCLGSLLIALGGCRTPFDAGGRSFVKFTGCPAFQWLRARRTRASQFSLLLAA